MCQNFAITVRRLFVALGCFFLLSSISHAQTAGKQIVPGSVPTALGKLHLQSLKDLPATNRLNLAIELPLRNKTALDRFLQQLQNPASTNYHRFLTPRQFTQRFGPTPRDCDAIVNFAKSNGLTVTGTSSNRTLVDVAGDVETIEKVFHVKMRVYRHPAENRDFFAPDQEPSVDLDVPLLHVSGLNNFYLPHPALVKKNNLTGVRPASGSGFYGWLAGADFRNAYIPGVSLNGSGQAVGLFELDGYYTNDVVTYENDAGLPLANVTNVLVDGYTGMAGNNNGEVALDIEMIVSLDTNLASVIVYEAQNGGIIVDLLNRIASDNLAQQISSSWLIGDDPGFDTAYQQMAAQGQSFFQASGDDGAYYTGDVYQEQSADDTNITIVGGTTLAMNGSGGSYSGETVWNWSGNGESYAASGGGTNYNSIPIPAWQMGIDMSSNGGSTALRNVPDVAMNADNIFIVADNNQQEEVGGTSAAAPLWAAFTALANERAAVFGVPPMGFLNPTIYAIGMGPGYATNFNDIIDGSNATPDTMSSEGTNYIAAPGYDLCTGWGSPVGGNLLATLVPSDSLTIAPLIGFNSTGPWSGPYLSSTQTFSITNAAGSPLCWSLINTSSWLCASTPGGALDPDASTNEVITVSATADSLLPGSYSASIQFSNSTTSVVQTFPFSLHVIEPLVVTPPGLASVSGEVGGPFSMMSEAFTLSNSSDASLNWQAGASSNWLDVSAIGGAIAGGLQTNVTFSLNSDASNLVAGVYSTVISITNQDLGTVQSWPLLLNISQSVVLNGGFETGDFMDWTLSGDAGDYDFVDDSSLVPAITPHSGSYFAALGEVAYQAYLSQTLPTLPGRSYLISLWMNSPNVGSWAPNEFSVAWNGATLFDQINIPPITDPASGWTNLQFVVTATNNASILQIGGRDDYYYLGLDDVSVVSIPSAALQLPLPPGNCVTFSWNALAGVAYQVQSTTNLFPPNWVPLQTITATNSTVIFTDTNSMAGSPQMFYRLLVSP